jgi:glycosyltransferase involved in cell wall biosynthesis
MLKILQVSDLATPHLGGTEKIVWKYSTLLKNRGNELSIYTLSIPGTKEFEVIDGISIYRKSKIKYFSIGFDKKLTKFDIVHTHSMINSITLNLYKKLNRKSVVISHYHDGYDQLLKEYSEGANRKKLERFVPLLIRGDFDCYITPSNYAKDKLIRFGVKRDKIEVLPHGVEDFSSYDKTLIRKKYGIDEKSKIIGFVGRLTKTKGPQYLVDFMPEILKNVDATLLLVGPNPDQKLNGFIGLQDQLQKRVKELDIEKNVIFTGPVQYSDMPYYYNAFDILAAPTISEAFGLSILESLNAGKPVVAFNSTAVPELVIDDKNGILIDPSNYEAMSSAIIKILIDQDLYLKYSYFAKEFAKNYRWNNIIDKLSNIYAKFLS